jgi:hypothetical protein
MEQSYPLELESFSTKVKIVEGKLGWHGGERK